MNLAPFLFPGKDMTKTDQPLISIITPSLNRAQFIEEAIESVLHQDYTHVEHIVVDGGSTDGTLDLLSAYPHLRVISEPDQGVYDAFNKGIRLAGGEIIGILNSDDYYGENIFSHVAELFVNDPQLDMVVGGATVFEQDSDGTPRPLERYARPKAEQASYSNIILGKPFINARFMRKDVFQRIGPFDTSYRLAADRDFLIRGVLGGIKSACLNKIACYYRRHPGSLTITPQVGQAVQRGREHLRIAEHYLKSRRISSEARRCLRLWHSRETSEMILLALRAGRCREAGYYVLCGWRQNAYWPWFFFSRILPRIVRLPYRRWISKVTAREYPGHE